MSLKENSERGYSIIKNPGIIAGLSLLLTLPIQGVPHIAQPVTKQKSSVLISLSYAPTFAGITDFEVGEAYDNSTKALLPYTQSDNAHVLRSDRFDWITMDGKLTFGNSSKMAVAGSVGLKLRGGAKFELEIGHEKFPARYHNEDGERESNTGLYLLAKDMANAVVGDKKEQLTERLLNTPREDLARFAEALRAAEPKTYRSLFSDDPQGFGLLLILNDIGDPKETLKNGLLWLKDKIMIRPELRRGGYDLWQYVWRSAGSMNLDRFRPGLELLAPVSDDDTPVPVSDIVLYKGTPISTPLYEVRKVVLERHVFGRNAKIINPKLWYFSKTGEVNITEFKDKFKEAVTRFLANAIEGGEVVEIDNVRSTSVMLNTCYEMAIAKQTLIPYACAGLGYSMLEIAASDTVYKPAYKVKMGLGVQVARNVTAHIGVYYHQVLSRIKDMKLSVLRLVDDISPDGRTKDAATASFNMAYSGCELGLSFAL